MAGQWIGFSLDEITRIKGDRVRYVQSCYPLIDLRMTRERLAGALFLHRRPDQHRDGLVSVEEDDL